MEMMIPFRRITLFLLRDKFLAAVDNRSFISPRYLGVGKTFVVGVS